MAAALSTSPARQRFTLDGGRELERQLEALCQGVGRAVLRLVPRAKLEGLVLGGGYGRGQGGVLKTDGGEAPYNDLEFYVFIRGNHLANARRYRDGFAQLEQELSPSAGLHVEFKLDSLRKLRQGPVSIFSYDLVSGHRVIFGPESLFAGCERHAESSNIPAAEATRLLLNRGSGLLLAQELLLRNSLGAEACDFIGRNLAKAELALGDALLAMGGQYHWDCLERARRLRTFESAGLGSLLSRVRPHHSAGVRFKLHPVRQRKDSAELRCAFEKVVKLALEEWLLIENQRLSTRFGDFRQYALSGVDKCGLGGFWKNLALNLRTFGAAAVLDRNSARYPRQRLLSALPLLLSERDFGADAVAVRILRALLRTQAKDWPGWVAAYKPLWHCYG